jgi:hypothetical protein
MIRQEKLSRDFVCAFMILTKKTLADYLDEPVSAGLSSLPSTQGKFVNLGNLQGSKL